MKLDDIGNLFITLNRETKIVIDGVVEISIATNKNASLGHGQVTLKIVAPKELQVKRAPIYINAPPKRGDGL